MDVQAILRDTERLIFMDVLVIRGNLDMITSVYKKLIHLRQYRSSNQKPHTMQGAWYYKNTLQQGYYYMQRIIG